jgi:hypothetical protein
VYALGKEATRAQELGSYRLIERARQGRHGRSLESESSPARTSAAIKLLQPILALATMQTRCVASSVKRR